jgi:CspA family cold shock protein
VTLTASRGLEDSVEGDLDSRVLSVRACWPASPRQICRSAPVLAAYARDVSKPWTRGTTKAWHAEEGWGVIESPDLADDVWVHFSDILGEGYRELASSEPVEFRYEEREQDGFRYAAVSVRRLGGHA